MINKSLITGQSVSAQMYQRARELRREMTPAEARLWQHLKADRLDGYHFRRQQIIDRFIVDFYCHKSGLVVEVDGEVHLSQFDYDHERDRSLQDCGLKVLRFLNSEIENNLESVLAIILAACRLSEHPDYFPESG